MQDPFATSRLVHYTQYMRLSPLTPQHFCVDVVCGWHSVGFLHSGCLIDA